ncbi:MAG: molybdenum cofactor guanylyltransferase MobA [Alphaproteobacteria bacterium]|nr:molybdenum cofactor guanylyltransferase MobA [Alphaproteobacteria bacterium]
MINALHPSGPEDVVGVLLAGGLSRRFGGGDKCLNRLGGRTILERVAARAAGQVGRLFLNAAGDPSRFPDLGLPVVADVIPGAQGPLAGVLTAMEWAGQNAPGARWVASFATDAPFCPADMVARMLDAVQRDGADMAVATSNGRAHPVFALWPVSARDDLRTAVVEQHIRRVREWTDRHALSHVDFPPDPQTGLDPFFNVNTPDDLNMADRLSVLHDPA